MDSSRPVLYERVGDSSIAPEDEPFIEGMDAREAFWAELVRAREEQRKLAMAEGRLDDPLKPRRLEDAITIQGTCPDMCPRFERFRREREANLMTFEVLPPPHYKRVNHPKAVKMYERAIGDKIIPSDLRPEPVLIRTLDYLFHELLPEHGFAPTWSFVRDRTRAVRTEFTMQRLDTPGAMASFRRCARYHALAFNYLKPSDFVMEDAMIMNTLQSLKEMWSDARALGGGTKAVLYDGELEMRLYHRLIHIRDQRERNEDVPSEIAESPVFKLVTQFRLHVQKASAPIKKNSDLKVEAEGMQLFGQVIAELSAHQRHPNPGLRTGKWSMFLVACILERLFGKGTVGEDQMTMLRAGLSDADIIDGIDLAEGQSASDPIMEGEASDHVDGEETGFLSDDEGEQHGQEKPSLQDNSNAPAASSIFGSNQPSIFSSGAPSAFGAFGTSGNAGSQATSVFGHTIFGSGIGSSSPKAPNNVTPSAQTSAFSTTFSSNPLTLGAPPNASTSASAFAVPEKSVFSSASTSHSFAPPPSTADSRTPPSLFAPSTISKPQVTTNQSNSTLLNPHAKTFFPSSIIITPPPEALPAPTDSTVHEPSSNATNLTAPSQSTFVSSFSMPSISLSPAPPNLIPTASPSAPTLAPSERPLPGDATLLPTSTREVPTASLGPRVAFPFMPRQDKPFGQTGSLPKLDTNLPSGHPSQPSPVLPNAPRHDPISLPSTPTSDVPPSTMPPASQSATLLTRQPTIPSPLRFPAPGATSSLSFPSSSNGLTRKSSKPLLNQTLLAKLDVANLPTSTSPSKANDILSPLVISSPGVSRMGSMETLQSIGLGLVNGASGSPIIDKGKGRQIPIPTPPLNIGVQLKDIDLSQLADRFFLQRIMGRWKTKSRERVEYKEAVKRSVHYGKQLRSGTGTPRRGASVERSGRGSIVMSETSKRRRLDSEEGSEFGGSVWSVGTNGIKKRRRRSSGKYEPPRSDEELERRLIEVGNIFTLTAPALTGCLQKQKETAIRWSPNSFLDHIKVLERKHHQRSSQPPSNCSNWTLWVSCNPENDGTAIWIEKKFGVNSENATLSNLNGRWITEAIYQVPVSDTSSGRSAQEDPGLLVFEISPLEGVGDSIERKYRGLDDCSRLRDMIHALPTRRQYVPSLLILFWPNTAGQADIGPDFVELVSSFLSTGVISSWAGFDCTTPAFDLDPSFKSAINSLHLDFDGSKLAKRMTLRTAFGLLEDLLRVLLDDLIGKCTVYGVFNWTLYSWFLPGYIQLLQRAGRTVGVFIGAEVGNLLSENLDVSAFLDDETAYRAALSWLEHQTQSQAIDLVIGDIDGHQRLHQSFPARPFLDHLRELLYTLASEKTGLGTGTFMVLNQDIDNSVLDFRKAVAERQADLSREFGLSMRRNPKRPAISSATSSNDESLSTSTSKRPRLSNDFSTSESGSAFLTPAITPSPEVEERMSVNPSPPPAKKPITLAMLRARTQNMRKKLGSGLGNS
ncbi:hypothetical protein DL96DRAFT_1790754 [Flagelloscypha sp. PMI_526]|nr:hypothetical protein DL96DRAFT_1790754 [Flagelloscypha sp. PMI_526]